MSKKFHLTAEPRTLTGKKARRLLRAMKVPGALYNVNGATHPVQFSEKELNTVLLQAGTTHIIEVELNGQKYDTLLREVDREPMTARIRHVNLWALPAGSTVDVEVPVKLVGDSPAVKSGGTLVHPQEKLHVRCLPTDIPEFIEVDISGLVNYHDSVHVRDLKLPGNIRVLDDPDATLVTIAPPKGVSAEEEGTEGSLE
ncbi:MAG: 50S ribosomal protein L25 [Fimbriimonadales bacterium]